MRNSSRGESVEDFLKHDNPQIASLLRCDDVQAAWRSKNRQLVNIFSKTENIHKIIDVLHTSKDFQTDRHILGICISPNTMILRAIIDEVDLAEHLVEILEKPKSVHRYVIGIVMQILLKAFDTWPDDVLYCLQSSRKIYPKIVASLQFPAVFHFSSRIIPRSNDVVTFAWVTFAALMDAHGTGPKIPSDVNKDVTNNAVIPKLNPLQRQKAIEILCIYFNEYGNRSELFTIVSQAIPLMLQDASDDQERALVIRLGLNLEPNEALGYSVLSVVNCFKSTDILLQYSLLYIAAWNVMIGNKSIEFFVYRLLKRPANNFVLIACAAMIRKVLEVDPRNKDLSEGIKQIVDHAYANNPYMKSNMMMTFRIELLHAAQGLDMEPESTYCAKQLKNANKTQVVKFNQSLIDDFVMTDKKIIENNEIYHPEFNVKQLWKTPDLINKMSSIFKTITRLPHLDPSNSISRPLPSPSPKKPAKRQSFAPKSKEAPIRMPKKQSHSDDEDLKFKDDEDIDDDDKEPHTLDPPPLMPLLIQDGLRPPSLMIASDDDDSEEEEDFDFELPEVEVSESFAQYQSRLPVEPPITEDEANSEKLPTETLAKGQKPIPKINPESPRSNKAMFLNDRLFNEERPSPRISRRPAPIIIPHKQLILEDDEEDEEDYEYEYEYVDEQEFEQQQKKVQEKVANLPVIVANPSTKLSNTKLSISTPQLQIDNDMPKPVQVSQSPPVSLEGFPKPQIDFVTQIQTNNDKSRDFLLQLDLNQIDAAPEKNKVVMHRRVLVIEVPEKQPPKLFLAPTLSVERPEIPLPLLPKKVVVAENPRIFFNYNDEYSEEEEEEEDNHEEFVEEVISFVRK
ncbi:hypothetical protein TVAG_062130 [Trichomonas vaginalis G3]|uniref:Uncharacterized protein n=1 Tax=Trichomonas vaginalis (strain ATCC PRA-98 / G3) TaxID=412133 RepID=A2G8M4_TRIV3|nr:serine/threonine-protein phosphatase 6 regulatory subunit family [Trichomonas vaginalis G3]EAX86492.1 hypothetical protein TVAG_062130 [Trichomonas vaginalis G3]KAI5520375.1 serine/threonine-protein phosphatase 6 regulatory subunit family [Trichomonas vaginalis G3]|eukprot:XP_001299422.1 hypothetical protein [Trichomonas vaginalis G3]